MASDEGFQPSNPPGCRASVLLGIITILILCGTLMVGCNTILNAINLDSYNLLQ